MAKQYEIAALAKQFQDLVDATDDYQPRILLSRVLMYVNQGQDVSPVLPSVVKLLAHRDVCVKRLAGEAVVLCTCRGANNTTTSNSNNSDMVLLAINCLLQDCAHSNPLCRELALKTLSSLQHDIAVEHLQSALTTALSDKSAHVRRGAVLACVRLHHTAPSALRESGDLIDMLYTMIRDPDPLVVTNCLAALDEVLGEEGGVVVNKPIAHYLLGRLSSFPAWSLVQVLNILSKYSPGSKEETFSLMDALDSCMDHNSPTVVLTCLQLFLQLHTDHPPLQSQVFKRAQPALAGHLMGDNVEVTVCVLDTLSANADVALPHFYTAFQSFFCRNRDPLYLKLKKISLLPRLITQDNGEAILEELRLYCVNKSEDVSLQALRAVRITHQHNQFLQGSCEETFRHLTTTSSLHVLSGLLQILQTVQISDKSFWDNLILPITRHFHSFTDNKAKAAALYIIGERLRDSAEAFEVLEGCVDVFDDLGDGYVKQQLLTALTKMFLDHPCEVQGVLGAALEVGAGDCEGEVKGRARFLYRLLRTGLDTARSLLLGPDADDDAEVKDDGDEQIDQEK